MMTSESKQTVLNWLNDNHIDYEEHNHQPIFTVEEGQKIAEAIGSFCCKSLLVKNKKKFFLIVLDSKKKFSSKDAAKELQSGHLSFASAEDLSNLMGTFAGAVSLLGLIFDKDKKVSLVLDKDILSKDHIDCHPCTNDCSIKLKVADVLEKVLPALGAEPTVLNVPSESE